MDARAFTMEILKDGIILTRFKEHITLTMDDMRQLGAERSAIANGNKYKALTVIPEDIDFDLSVPTTDLTAVSGANVVAAAIVVSTVLSERIIKMHFDWFPRDHAHQVFNDEHEAMAWLQKLEL